MHVSEGGTYTEPIQAAGSQPEPGRTKPFAHGTRRECVEWVLGSGTAGERSRDWFFGGIRRKREQWREGDVALRDTKCDPWVTVECNRADEDPTQCWYWMRRWLIRRRNEAKMQKEDYLFRWASGKPLTAPQFRQRMGAAMDAAGIERQGFEGMSVRRGGATGLARAGVEDRVIATAGRWSSSAYRLYVEVGAEELRAAMMKMAGDTTIVTDPQESYCQREDGAKVHVGRMDNPRERETWNGVMSGRLEARKGGQPKAEPGAAEGEQGGR